MQYSGVADVDRLAEQMYSSPDLVTRQQAQASLEPLIKEDADSSFHITILQQSNNQYTLLFMAQGLVLWYNAARKWMSIEQKREFVVVHCGGCLKRIFDSGAPKHVVTSLLTAYAKLTKLSFENEPFLEAAVDFPLELLQQEQVESSYCLLSLMLLNTIVVEFSKFDSSKTQTYLTFVAHRHCSSNFKEKSLLNIFMIAVRRLEQVTANSPHVAEIVKLVESCLCFDFRAITVDDTEDLPFAQFPQSWKSILLNLQYLNLLWGKHAELPYPLCASLLTGMMSICGVHRTFFDTPEERSQYLKYTLTVLTETTMLQDGRLKIPKYVELFTETCRRVLLSFGYRDLYQLPVFGVWINAMRMVSMEVVSIPFGQEGSLSTSTTVMSYWVALSNSKRRSYSDQNQRDIEDIALQVLQAFIEARVRTPEGGGGGGGGDGGPVSLNDDDGDHLIEAVISQSESYTAVCLLDPVMSLNALANYLDQQVGTFILSSPSSRGWLFFLAGAILRIVPFNMENSGVEPCARLCVYLAGCTAHSPRGGDAKICGSFVERGLLYFLTSTQLMLLGVHNDNISAVVVKGFGSHAGLFQFILDNAGCNLLRGDDDPDAAEIIRESADLITNCCRDVQPSFLKDLTFDLPPISELPLAQSERTYKLRTNLMRALWFIGRSEPNTRERMEAYLYNVEVCMRHTVNNEMTSTSFIAGWLRDLRGACQALNEDENIFADFIDWFCARFDVFNLVLDIASNSSVVVIALMRFLCELVTPGRYGRLHVSSSSNSAMGLMLFKHLCGLIAKVGGKCFASEHIMALEGSSSDYQNTLKPWMLSMEILKLCVQGSFVPFGAMLYYNDETFEYTTAELLCKLTLLGPNLFKEHAKFATTALDLLRSLTEENLYYPLRQLKSNELLTLINIVILICEDVDAPSGVLLFGLSFLAFIAGLVREVKAMFLTPSQQPSLSGTAAALGNSGSNANTPPPPISPMLHGFVPPLQLQTSATRSGTQSRPPRFAREVREQLAALLVPYEDLWQRLITVAMNIIAFRDRAVSASSAVVFPIFEAHPPFWFGFMDQFVASFPERKQSAVREALSVLTHAGETQEKFFSEVFTFRQALRRLNV
ncbi:uncharacterized protein TM35_000021960 [Trypanosoma theileri]|uniref:Uncharacterized protein n=1 Tax=Trypanosoma theileri TaxID=67003 RepID=A0A1X0P8U4_9TRYP|nr:uncharacterized protein TM35_000021960 [Trypanosoma theileri]ORC92870.1 hypothetical protein TM35_000021960 [Trypanosoma theileri]